MLTSTKPNKCRHCKVRMPEDKARHVLHDECFQPWLTKQLSKQAAAREKKDRAEFRERKERAKRTSKWEEECRTIVQAIARIRDKDDGCISCHLPATWGGQWHGSHFRSHGAASAVQFHLWNIHKSCSSCNRDKGGNIIAYRPRLVEKIGQEKVDWLMSQNQIVRHSVDYYKRFKAVMGKRLRRLQGRNSRGL
jgi:hypothetical protein